MTPSASGLAVICVLATAGLAPVPAAAMPDLPRLHFPEQSGPWGCHFRGECASDTAGDAKK